YVPVRRDSLGEPTGHRAAAGADLEAAPAGPDARRLELGDRQGAVVLVEQRHSAPLDLITRVGKHVFAHRDGRAPISSAGGGPRISDPTAADAPIRRCMSGGPASWRSLSPTAGAPASRNSSS